MIRTGYNHKLDKLVSTHPLGDFIVCVVRRNALKLAQKDNQIGSNACGYDSDDGAKMNAGVGFNGQRNTL